MPTAEIKTLRVEICQQLWPCYEHVDEEFVHNIVTADKTWLQHYEPQNKHLSMEYHYKGLPVKNKFKPQALAGKVMVTVFWDADRVIHMYFPEFGTAINSEHYTATLKTLKQQLSRLWRHKKNTLLQHDNARPHTLQTTMETTGKVDLTILLRKTIHSWRHATSIFFPKMKEYLHVHLYDSNKELERIVWTWMKKTSMEFFRDGFENSSIFGGSVWRIELVMWRSKYRRYKDSFQELFSCFIY
jgi:hypothetical protein